MVHNKIAWGWMLLIVLLSASCNTSTRVENSNPSEKRGGILVVNQFQGFSTLFPPSAYESSSNHIGGHMYETLVDYDPESKEVVPLLAESWEMDTEGLKYVFKIREGVYFHDDPSFEDGVGRVVEPEDVLFCLKYLCQKSPLNRNSWLFSGTVLGAKEFYDSHQRVDEAEIEGLKLLDDSRIEITLEKPNMEFINVLAHFGTSIYPREALDHYGKAIDENCVGTGPFKQKVLRMNEVCIMERNKSYWAKDEEGHSLPYLDGLKFNFETHTSSLAKAMSTGVLHVVINADMEDGGEQLIRYAKGDKSQYALSSEDDQETVYLGFLNDEGVFSDGRVRRAFGLVLDREKISEQILGQSCGPGHHGLIPPGFNNFPYDRVQGFTLDVDSAKELMAAAGYAEGKGFPVVTLQIQNRYKDVVVAQEIQQQLLDHLGVSLSITALPREQHFQRIEERQAMLWLDNWIGDYLDPQNFLSLMLSRNSPEQGESYLNTYRYANSTYDSIVQEALKTNDPVRRMDLYAQADEILVQDAAIAPIYYEKNRVIKHRSVHGLSSLTLGQMDLRKVFLQD